MERKIRVFLADLSPDLLWLLTDLLEDQPDMEVVGCGIRGDEICAALTKLRPDVLITDLLLPGQDGLSLLCALKREGRLPRTIVYSGYQSAAAAEALELLGVEDYLEKSCSPGTLLRRIRELAASTPAESSPRRAAAIREALLEFGVDARHRGFPFLAEGIAMTLGDRNVLRGITKILYPDLAKRFGVSDDRVERSIRDAVDKAWREGDADRRRQYFGGLFDGFPKAPSNRRFITAIADFVETAAAGPEVWNT